MRFQTAIKNYYKSKGHEIISIERLGEGLVAEGFKVEYLDNGKVKKVVCRRLQGHGMSHDYLPDRVGYLLLQHAIANSHPKHTKSIDVVTYGKELSTISLDDLEDVFQVVEFANGDSYYTLIDGIKRGFSTRQQKVIVEIADYMRLAHKIEPDESVDAIKNYYWRHSQDFIGSEVLMDILDVWPTGQLMSIDLRTEFISKIYRLREETRKLYMRCRLIHSDLHPDNIRVKKDNTIEILDSARSMWGEPIDDLTSMLANYVFFGIRYSKSKQKYKDAYNLLLNSYFKKKIDSDSNKLARIYFPIRLLILSHPIFFSNDSIEIKNTAIDLAMKILSKEDFKLNEIWDLL